MDLLLKNLDLLLQEKLVKNRLRETLKEVRMDTK